MKKVDFNTNWSCKCLSSGGEEFAISDSVFF